MDGALPLIETERICIVGLQAREREARAMLAAVEADFATTRAAIEERLGLPPGALGATHDLVADPWCVRARPQPPAGDGDGDAA